MQKLTANVSEFAVGEEKVYLSPILDMYNGEIIAYDIFRHPDSKQTMDTLDRVFEKIPDNSGGHFRPPVGAFFAAERKLMQLPLPVHSETAAAVPHADSDRSWRVSFYTTFQMAASASG